jgi:superfamily I DNA and/or RNA helicase
MHPELGDMVSSVFYDSISVRNPEEPSQLELLAARRENPYSSPSWLRGKHIVWIDLPSVQTHRECSESHLPGGRIFNIAEARTVVACLSQMQAHRRSKDIAILTPYREQAVRLRALLADWQFEAFGNVVDRVFTVDSFQGRQAGTVILSLVRNNDTERGPAIGIGFMARRERATVMFSRAERLLVVVGSADHFTKYADCGTSWVMEVLKRATVVPWDEVLPLQERRKLEERVNGA